LLKIQRFIGYVGESMLVDAKGGEEGEEGYPFSKVFLEEKI